MSKTIEQQVQEIQRLEEMCDDDSDQIVAMYRRNLRTALQERDRIAYERGISKGRKEERERIIALAGGEPYLYIPDIILESELSR